MYGANRNQVTRYPTRESGYGDLDLLGTFNIIGGVYARRTIESRKDFRRGTTMMIMNLMSIMLTIYI